MDGITKFPLKALEFYCHVKTVPQFTENLVIFLLVFNQQRENTWSTMGPFQEYEVSQDFCMLTQSFKKKRTSVVWRNWGICTGDRCCVEQEKKSPEKGSPRSRIPRLVLHHLRTKDKCSPLSDSPFSEEEGKECDLSSDHSKRTISTNSFCSGKVSFW